MKTNQIYDRNATLQAINKLVAEQKLTTSNLGFILNLSKSAVSLKLNGLREFTLDELIILCNLFDMDFFDLVKFKEEGE